MSTQHAPDPTAVFFDAPGPKARRRNLVYGVVGAVVVLGIAALVVSRFAAAGQLDARLWEPFLYADIQTLILEAAWSSIRAALVGGGIAVVLGMLFAILRLSGNRVVSGAATVLIEFFRGLPVLLVMFAAFLLGLPSFWAVVFGLAVYNGMVLAETIRAGILSVPKGQREAGLTIGLRPLQVTLTILMPQAIRAMLPAIVAQMVVVLKDSALGYLVTYQELLYLVNQLGRDYQNLLPSYIVGAAVFIVINLTLSWCARFLERTLNRRR